MLRFNETGQPRSCLKLFCEWYCHGMLVPRAPTGHRITQIALFRMSSQCIGEAGFLYRYDPKPRDATLFMLPKALPGSKKRQHQIIPSCNSTFQSIGKPKLKTLINLFEPFINEKRHSRKLGFDQPQLVIKIPKWTSPVGAS